MNKNIYKQTKMRVKRHTGKFNISDKEIIEELAKEIEEDRNKIEQQNKIIDELKTKTIQSEECILDTTNELIDSDIEEIISTTKYTEGRPIKSTMEYKYKES